MNKLAEIIVKIILVLIVLFVFFVVIAGLIVFFTDKHEWVLTQTLQCDRLRSDLDGRNITCLHQGIEIPIPDYARITEKKGGVVVVFENKVP